MHSTQSMTSGAEAGNSGDTGLKRQDAGNFLWNAVGGVLNAGQSVFLLIVITRVCGLEAAGIFSIAFATGNLFLYLGNYGVRNYQVSDLSEKYSFHDYLRHRLCTVLLMLAAAAVYTAWSAKTGNYSHYKTACVLAMCACKAVDCLEEVFEGRYQQKGRLDRSGKLVTFRLLVSIGGMIAVLLVTRDLLTAVWWGVFLAAAASALIIWQYRETAAFKRTAFSFSGIAGLMRECFPVCAANFLSFYLINEPKYAIDAAMDETAQACYNFIAMPVFVIQLLNMFLYQPMLIRMTASWENGRKKEFLGYFGRICGALALISAPILLAAWILGIPVLSWLYATDLSALRTELLLIMTGGIFLAFNGFYCAVLTIMRKQKEIPLTYLAGAVLSLAATPAMVRKNGIIGAVLSFVLVMAAVTVLLTARFAFALRNKDA